MVDDTTDTDVASLQILESIFPEISYDIKICHRRNPVFRKICSDYIELFNWLQQNPPQVGQNLQVYDQALEKLVELGKELRSYLYQDSLKKQSHKTTG